MQYGVYRLCDVNKTMEGGNMEVMCYFDKKKDAQQKAKELNAHEAETYWNRGNEDE